MFINILKLFSYIYETFLDLIYNRKCLICSCSKVDNLLCKNCLKEIGFLSSFPHKIYNGVEIYSACLYEKNIKKLIHLLKFSHRKTSAIVLGDLLFTYFKKLNLKDDYIIIYPPTFFTKNLFRGYKHMYLIAKEFSKHTNFKILNDLLFKTKYTKPQYKAKNRHSNIKNSFSLNSKYNNLKDKHFLLLDDITTSGATLEEIINLLKENNFNNITCLTVSKTK